jgi:hypothetical protein
MVSKQRKRMKKSKESRTLVVASHPLTKVDKVKVVVERMTAMSKTNLTIMTMMRIMKVILEIRAMIKKMIEHDKAY